MKTRITINGEEVTSRGQKFIILSGVLILSLMLSALILFVFLPLMGVIIAFSTAAFIVAVVLIVVGAGFAIFGQLFIETLAYLSQRFTQKK